MPRARSIAGVLCLAVLFSNTGCGSDLSTRPLMSAEELLAGVQRSAGPAPTGQPDWREQALTPLENPILHEWAAANDGFPPHVHRPKPLTPHERALAESRPFDLDEAIQKLRERASQPADPNDASNDDGWIHIVLWQRDKDEGRGRRNRRAMMNGGD